MNKFYKNDELQDVEILEALAYAHDDYDNGAILEVRNVLAQIVMAIDLYTSDYEI